MLHDTKIRDLNTVINALSSSIATFADTLSTAYMHPYDAAAAELFDKDHVFPTVEDIVVPDVINTETIIKGLEAIGSQHQTHILEYLNDTSKYDVTHCNNQVTLLSELSTDNKFVTTLERKQKYHETLEVIQNIDITSINENNCKDIIQKLGYKFLNIFQKTP